MECEGIQAKTRRFLENQAQRAAFEAASSGMMIGDVERAQPQLSLAINNANEVYKNLSEISDILGNHLDRILGTHPEAREDKSSETPVPDSEISALRIEISNLGVLASRIRQQVGRLASL